VAKNLGHAFNGVLTGRETYAVLTQCGNTIAIYVILEQQAQTSVEGNDLDLHVVHTIGSLQIIRDIQHLILGFTASVADLQNNLLFLVRRERRHCHTQAQCRRHQ
jgi:hypothetical protein